MAAYLEIIKKQMKARWVYRSNFYLNILGNLLYYFIMVNVWQALYKTNTTVNGVRLSQMITYTLITALISGLSSSNIAYTIASQVKDGTIGGDLAKPVDYKGIHIARQLGGNLMMVLCMNLPSVILLGCIYGMDFTVQWELMLLFLVSMGFGVAISFTISFLFGVIAFWLKTAEYASFLQSACHALFSGGVVPLWFYPEALRNVAMFLPFRFTIFEPVAIFLGSYTVEQALQILLYQAVWLVGLTVLERCLWFGIQRHLVIQGG